MGYNTVILVRNDALGEIEAHSEQFTDGVVTAIQGSVPGYHPVTVRVGNYANPVEVMQSVHASDFGLYAVHGNTVWELSPNSDRFTAFANHRDEWGRSQAADLVTRARRTLDGFSDDLSALDKLILTYEKLSENLRDQLGDEDDEVESLLDALGDAIDEIVDHVEERDRVADDDLSLGDPERRRVDR